MTPDQAERRLRAALAQSPNSTVAIMAPEPIASLFKGYVEAIRTEQIEIDQLQTHMEDVIAKLDEDAKP
jgi:hypothetical protein